MDFIKGKLIGIVVSILLLIWFIPWHYYRYRFMIIHNYDPYLIWSDIGGRVFFTIFAVSAIILAGHIVDTMNNGGY